MSARPSATRSRTPGILAAAAAGALLVGSAAAGPVVPFVLVGAIGLVALAAARPKAFAAVGTVLIALAVPIQNIAGSTGGYIDEAVVLIAAVAFGARRLATRGGVLMLPGTPWFVLFVVLGIASAIAHDVATSVWLPGAFLTIKGLLFAWALAQLPWSRSDLRGLVRWGAGATVAVGALGLLNLAMPAFWAHLTTGAAPLRGPGGLPELNGPFQHPAAFSRFLDVLAIGALAYAFTVRRKRASLVLAGVAAVLLFLTFETKSLVGLLVVVALLCVRFANLRGVVAAVCLLPLVIAGFAPTLASLVGTDVQSYVQQDSARGRLTLGGAEVAVRYFPLGAGFGRWGSSTAATEYSPEYTALGFPEVYGLGPGDDGMFLNDTQWPAIYGEAGWLGGAAFAIGLGCLLVSLLRRTSRTEPSIVLWLRTAGAGWMVALGIESLVGPVFVSTPSFPFMFAAAGIVTAIRRDGLAPDPRNVAVAEAQPINASRQAASITG